VGTSLKNMRIAVYTANIGGYDEVRHKYIAQVPEGIDAFYFLDVKSMRNNEKALHVWRKQGWNISMYSQIDGTQFVNGPRLTGKQIKFTPPRWIVDGYDWLIYQDANVMINLVEMESFLRLRQKHALVLLDWCHEYPMCCGQGMKCFNESTRYYIKEAPKRIPEDAPAFLNKMNAWRDFVVKSYNQEKLSIPRLYSLPIIFRNLKHTKAADVELAFAETFQKLHEIRTDTPVLPVFLSDHNVSEDVGAVNFNELHRLGFRKVSNHKFLDL